MVSVIHSSFLGVLGRFALSADRDNVKMKSLLQSAECSKNCRDRTLELLLDWQQDLDEAKYPNFRATFVELKRSGAAFDKIIAERERIRKQQEFEAKNRRFSEDHKREEVEYRDEPKFDNPWSRKHLPFGRWYKSKLKADISKLLEMVIFAQTECAVGAVSPLSAMELREAHKRLLCLTLRTEDPAAIDVFFHLLTVMGNILDCHKALSLGRKPHRLPGVTLQSLQMIVRAL